MVVHLSHRTMFFAGRHCLEARKNYSLQRRKHARKYVMSKAKANSEQEKEIETRDLPQKQGSNKAYSSKISRRRLWLKETQMQGCLPVVGRTSSRRNARKTLMADRTSRCHHRYVGFGRWYTEPTREFLSAMNML